jgi:hypothetical protein
MEAQKATDLRRLLAEVEANERALRLRQEELEAHLAGAPAANWEEAAEKARYVLGLYAATLTAEDTRRRTLVEAARPATPAAGLLPWLGPQRPERLAAFHCVAPNNRNDRADDNACQPGGLFAEPSQDFLQAYPLAMYRWTAGEVPQIDRRPVSVADPQTALVKHGPDSADYKADAKKNKEEAQIWSPIPTFLATSRLPSRRSLAAACIWRWC